MINKDELLFVVDEDNNPLKPQTREVTHRDGYWHRVAHIWILNEDSVLCQQRSLIKDKKPGYWEPFFGGHVTTSMEFVDCARTELAEEIGLRVENTDLAYVTTYKNLSSKEFQAVFTYKKSVDMALLVLEKEEVACIQWHKVEVIRKYIADKKLTWSIPKYSLTFLPQS